MLVSAIAGERPDQSRLSEELLLQLPGHSLQIAPKDVSGCHKFCQKARSTLSMD